MIEVPEITSQVSGSIAALTREFEIITHNLANVSTVGFKRRCNAFVTSLQKAGDGYAPGQIDLNSVFDFSQGNLVQTGRNLDFALFGRGFFVIETPDGPLYTRNGSFTTNQNGQVADSTGRVVAGDAGPIVIPPTVGTMQIQVSGDGTISAGQVALGRFQLVDFGENESKLVPVGQNCFRMPDPDMQPTAAENIVVKEGFQESSNVNIVEEMVNMIMVTRLYEANMKLVSTASQASSSIMNVAMG